MADNVFEPAEPDFEPAAGDDFTPAADPDFEPADEAPPTPTSAIGEPSALNLAADLDARDQAENDRLDLMVKDALAWRSVANIDHEAQVQQLARNAGIDPDTARASYDELAAMWETSKFDAATFRRDRPEEAALLLRRPEAARVLLKDPGVSVLVKAFRAFKAAVSPGADENFSPTTRRESAATHHGPAPVVPEKTEDDLFNAEREASEKPGYLPAKVAQVENAKTRLADTMGPLDRAVIIAAQRGKESAAGFEIARMGKDLMLSRMGQPGADELDAARGAAQLAQIREAQRANIPLALGESESEQVITDSVNGLVSTYEVGVEAVKTAGAWGTVGAVIGGGIGAVTTKTPHGAMAGMAKGLALTAGAGAMKGTFDLETGDYYLQAITERTDDGRLMTNDEATAGAVVYGAIATGIEAGEFAYITGPIRELFTTGGKVALRAEFKALMKRDPAFRALLRKAMPAVVGVMRGGGAEAGEESLQSASSDAIGYLMRSVAAGKLQAGPVVDVEKGLTAAGHAFAPGILMGGVAHATRAGLVRLRADQEALADDHAGAIQMATEIPTAAAFPEELAALVAQASGRSGKPVTHVYVRTEGLVRLFQGKADEIAGLAEQLLGEDGNRVLQQAVASGEKYIEVPTAAYFSRWGKNGVAKDLLDETTTDPAFMTRAERKERKPEVDAGQKELLERAEPAPKDEARAAAVDQAIETFAERLASIPVKGARAMASVARELLRRVATTTPELLNPEQMALDAKPGFDDAGFDFSAGPEADPLAMARQTVEAYKSPEKRKHGQRWLDYQDGKIPYPTDVPDGIKKQLADEGAWNPSDPWEWDDRGVSMVVDRSLGEKKKRSGGVSGKNAPKQSAGLRAHRLPDLAYGERYGAYDQPAVEGPEFARARAKFNARPVEERAGLLYRNESTGLLNQRGFERLPVPADRPLLAQFEVEGPKALNETQGHESLDAALRILSGVLLKNVPDGSKDQVSLHAYVKDQQQADDIATQMQAAVVRLAGGRVVRVTAATAKPTGNLREDLRALGASHRTFKRDEVKAGRYGHRKALPTAFSTDEIRALDFDDKAVADALTTRALVKTAGAGMADFAANLRKEGAAPMGQATITPKHLERAGHAKAFDEFAFTSQGLLTEEGLQVLLNEGFEVVSEGSADMRELQAANAAFGEDGANVLLEHLALLLSDISDGNVYVSNPHGDEYRVVARGLTPAQLRERFAVAYEHSKRVVFLMDRGELGFALQEGLPFASGAGETFDEADRVDLPRTKEQQGAFAGASLVTREATLARLGDLRRSGDFRFIDVAEVLVRRRAEDAGREGSRGEEVGSTRYEQPSDAPVWFSAVERAVVSAKQEKNTPTAWLALVEKTPGVKKEEVEFLGLREAMARAESPNTVDLRGSAAIGRKDVLDFIKAHRIEVKDVGFAEESNVGEKSYEAIGAAYRAAKEHYQVEAANWPPGDPRWEAGQRAMDHAERASQVFFHQDEPNWHEAHDLANHAHLIEEEALGVHNGPFARFAETVQREIKALTAAGLSGEGTPAHEGYTLKGHKPGSYKEIAFYAPGTPSDKFKAPSSHLPQMKDRGILAHARISEHVGADGNPVLFIEEIQSDLHQGARDKGYERRAAGDGASPFAMALEDLRENAHALTGHRGVGSRIADELREGRAPSDAVNNALSDADVAPDELSETDHAWLVGRAERFASALTDRRRIHQPGNRTPNAPFKTTWEELVVKRLIRYAAENGYERIAWTTGEQQAERYDLAKQVDSIDWLKRPSGQFDIAAMKDGREVFREETISKERVAELIGKEMAQKVMDGTGRRATVEDGDLGSLTGLNLKVGGEGMRAAYDRRIPSIFEKLGKKHGVKVEKTTIAAQQGGPHRGQGFRVEHEEDGDGYVLIGLAPDEDGNLETLGPYATESEAKAKAEELATASRQTGSEVWSATLPPALREQVLREGLPLFAGEGDPGGARGATEFFAEGQKRIYQVLLNDNADMSTVPHELAHVLLEQMVEVVRRDIAQPRVREDLATMLQWGGLKEGTVAEWDALTKEGRKEIHEKTARAFEAYLFKGEPPAKGLVRLFTRMKLWLFDIYRDIRKLGGLPPAPVRDVFDRLLATEDELRAERAKVGRRPMFASPAEAGMTPEQWTEYLSDQAEAFAMVNVRAEQRALKDRHRTTEAWWKQKERELREEAVEAYEKLPARQVQAQMKAQGIKLMHAEVVKAVGEDGAKRIPTMDEGGLHPNDAVEFFSADGQQLFTTGPAMLEALAALLPKAQWAKNTAATQMAEQFPDILDARTEMRAEVQKGLHGDYDFKWLKREWDTLRRRGGLQPLPLESVRGAAQKLVEARRVGRLDVGQTLASERAAANRATEAAAEQNFAAAHIAKEQQLLNMFLWRELSTARDERDAFLERAQKAATLAARARLGKASPTYRGGVDLLLETFGLKDPEEHEIPLPSLADVVLQMETDGATVGLDEEVLARLVAKPKSWKLLSLTEMRALDAALKNIAGAARTKATAQVDGKREDKDDVVLAIMAEARRNLASKGPRDVEELTAAQRVARRWNIFSSSRLRPESMLSEMVGGQDDSLSSMAHRAMVKPLLDGRALEAQLYREHVKPVMDAWGSMPAKVKKHLNDSIDGGALFPDHTRGTEDNILPPSKRRQLLMMVLHMGTQSSFDRLTEGRGVTEAQLRKAVDLLGKEELDWVQSVWDALDSLWPLARDLEERDSGLAPPKLEHRELVTKHGTYRGGYFTAVYTSDERAGQRQEANAVAELLDASFTRPGTARSHLKRRVEGFSGILSLNPSAMPRAFAQVVHDIAFREAVKSVGGLVLDPRIQTVLRDRLGEGRAKTLLQWVKDVGQMRGQEALQHASSEVEITRWLKGNQVTAVLGYSLQTALGDTTGLLQAVARTDLRTAYLADGFWKMGTSMFETHDEVGAKSAEVLARRDQVALELKKQVDEITESSLARTWALAPLRFLKDHAFDIFQWMDMLVTDTLWKGRYDQGIADGESEARAIEAADAVVRRTLPSHSVVDAPALLRDKTFFGALLMFSGYWLTQWNGVAMIAHPLTRPGESGKALKLKVAARLLAYLSVGTVLSELFSGRGPEDDESWPEWYARKMLAGTLSSDPFLGGPLASLGESLLMNRPPNPRAQGVAGALEGLVKGLIAAANEEKEPDDRIKALLRATGPFTGLPANQLNRTGGYLFDLSEGEREARTPFGFTSGVVYGERENQPANLLLMLDELARIGQQ